MARFGTWLAQARKLEAEAYGVIPADLSDTEYAENLRFNFLAAHAELSEALEHVPWKSYHGRTPGRPDEVDRLLAVTELIDVLHYVANLLVALGISDEDLEVAYDRKSSLNRERQDLAGARAKREVGDHLSGYEKSLLDTGFGATL